MRFVYTTYFVEAVGSRRIKIGRTTNLHGRITNMVSHCPFKLKLLGVTKLHENKMHKKFRHLRVKGEWYKATPELRNFIKELDQSNQAKKKRKPRGAVAQQAVSMTVDHADVGSTPTCSTTTAERE